MADTTLRRGVRLLVVGAALTAGVAMAVPAMAMDQSVFTMVGVGMELGDAFDGSCTKDDAPPLLGRGIGLPGAAPKTPGLNNKFALRMPGPIGFTPPVVAGVKVANGGLPGTIVAGTLELCGNITAVGGALTMTVGPWCGMSKGYEGRGKIMLAGSGGVSWANLSHVGWKFSVGTVLPVLGKARAQSTGPGGTKGPKEDKFGTLVGLLHVRSGLDSPPAACTDPLPAGQFFRVDIVAAILDSGGSKADVVTWNDNFDGDTDRNDNPIFCKGAYDFNDDGVEDTLCPLYPYKPKPTTPKDSD